MFVFQTILSRIFIHQNIKEQRSNYIMYLHIFHDSEVVDFLKIVIDLIVKYIRMILQHTDSTTRYLEYMDLILEEHGNLPTHQRSIKYDIIVIKHDITLTQSNVCICAWNLSPGIFSVVD